MEKPSISLSKSPRADSAEARINLAASTTFTRFSSSGRWRSKGRPPRLRENRAALLSLLPRHFRPGRGECQRGRLFGRLERVWGGAFGYSARGAVAAQTLAAAVNPVPRFCHLITPARRRTRQHPLICHRTFRGNFGPLGQESVRL